MKQQVVNVSVRQSAKVIATLYLLLAIPFGLLMAMMAFSGGKGAGIGLAALFLLPLLYAGLAFVGVAFSAWLYNFTVKQVGGLEYTISEVAERS